MRMINWNVLFTTELFMGFLNSNLITLFILMFLYALYMFRVFITHPQERHCKLGRRFDSLSMLVVVSYNT
jgi:hypothetical protein